VGKITRDEANRLVQNALEDFAAQLGLEYSTVREEIDEGHISSEFLPKSNLEVEVTKETKQVKDRGTIWSVYERYYGGFGYKQSTHAEATLLGKVNALAEFLGVTFEVQPEKVVTTPVKVKAVKKVTPKTSKVKATKKGKK